MRVVIDTNVFVSSFYGGHPRRIIDLWKTGSITLCLSSAILEEYIDVFQRMGLVGAKEFDELMMLFRNQYNCMYANRTPSLKICADPHDDKFIEAAVALKAEFIVSGDKHLKSLKNYSGILILPPKEFAEFLNTMPDT